MAVPNMESEPSISRTLAGSWCTICARASTKEYLSELQKGPFFSRVVMKRLPDSFSVACDSMG